MKPQTIEVMSSTLETVQPGDSLATAYKKMTGYRHLPVLDEDTNIVGIISDRDFKRAMTNGFSNPRKPQFKDWATVADYMSWPVTTVTFQTPLLKVIETMLGNKISAVLVTNNNELLGIVTSEDLLFVLAELLKQKKSFKEQIYEKINDWTFNSPIGQIINTLSDSGF